MIKLQHFSLYREQRCLLKDSQLHIKRGGFYALTGENGSGKSTLLKALLGELPVVSKDDYSPIEQGSYAYLPQKSQLDTKFPINVQQAVMSGLWCQFGTRKKIEARHLQQVQSVLQEVGIEHLKKSHISQLSGGELQRLLFARMLVQNAPLLILDEPLAAIDQNAQHMLLESLKTKHQQGSTIIITLHDAALVKRYVSEQLHIRDQKIHLCSAAFEHSLDCCQLPIRKMAS